MSFRTISLILLLVCIFDTSALERKNIITDFISEIKKLNQISVVVGDIQYQGTVTYFSSQPQLHLLSFDIPNLNLKGTFIFITRLYEEDIHFSFFSDGSKNIPKYFKDGEMANGKIKFPISQNEFVILNYRRPLDITFSSSSGDFSYFLN